MGYRVRYSLTCLIEIFFIARFYVEPHGGSRAGRAMNCATTNGITQV